MSLAAVKIDRSDFRLIHDHLVSHNPRYRSMHLRQARYRNKKRVLHYLHAMHASAGTVDEIEGMISGPGVFWHYKILNTKFGTQLNVLVERGSDKEKERLGKKFLSEILARVQLEQAGMDYAPVRLPGQFYLKRKVGGAPATHPNCKAAVSQKALDVRFVSELVAWDLDLLCP